MIDRATKERKLIALMLTDLELDLTEPEMVEVQQEVGELPDEELKRTLASRLNLPYPVDDQAMEQVLSRIEEPESLHGGQLDNVAGTADAGHGSRSPGELRD